MSDARSLERISLRPRPMVCREACVFAGAALVASIAMNRASVARAEEAEIVAWRAPDGCPDAAHVRADVARLGGVASGGAHATVIVVSRGGRWIASIAFDGSRAESRPVRDVEGATCAAVADAAALVIAIAFRESASVPTATSAAPPSSPPPSPVLPPTFVPLAPSRAESAAATRPTRTRAPFAAGLGAIGVSGALPSAALGAGVWLAYLPGRARFEIAGYATTPQSATLVDTAIGADFRLIGGAARACFSVVASERFDLAPCAGVDVAHISANGFGLGASRSNDDTRAAASLGALATWAIERAFALRLEIDGLVPTSRPRFVVDADDTTSYALHRPAAVWGRLLLGAEIRF